MKKFLLATCLLASFAPVFAAGSDSEDVLQTGLSQAELESASAPEETPANAPKASKLDRVRDAYSSIHESAKESKAGKFAREDHPVASKRVGIVVIAAVVAYAGKKAYNRYKVWKKAKAEKAVETENA